MSFSIRGYEYYIDFYPNPRHWRIERSWIDGDEYCLIIGPILLVGIAKGN